MSTEDSGYKVTQFRYESGGFIMFVLENKDINDGFSVRIPEVEFDAMNDNQFNDFVQPLIEARIDEITAYRATEKTKHDAEKAKLKGHSEKELKFKIKKSHKDKEDALKPEHPMQP